jgi:hypothetical protein
VQGLSRYLAVLEFNAPLTNLPLASVTNPSPMGHSGFKYLIPVPNVNRFIVVIRTGPEFPDLVLYAG